MWVGDSTNDVRGVVDAGVAGDRPTRIDSIEFIEAGNETRNVIPPVESDILMTQHNVLLSALGARLTEHRERVVPIGLCVVEPTETRETPIKSGALEGCAHLRVVCGSVEDSADVEKAASSGCCAGAHPTPLAQWPNAAVVARTLPTARSQRGLYRPVFLVASERLVDSTSS